MGIIFIEVGTLKKYTNLVRNWKRKIVWWIAMVTFSISPANYVQMPCLIDHVVEFQYFNGAHDWVAS